MKGKKPRSHRVPLSDAALGVLCKARKLGDGDVVFPTRRGGTVGTRDLLRAVQAAGLHDVMSVHGMRAAFRTWADEVAEADFSVAEICLAHTIGDSTVRAYARSDLFARRRRLMDDWANTCAGTLSISTLRGRTKPDNRRNHGD